MECITFEPYRLIKYLPSMKYDPSVRHLRSIIYKGDTAVCMSPGKSVPLDDSIPLEEYVIEEFVEGVMINVFYDGEWKIATKSNVGANCTFESHRTFAELFEECKQAVGLSYEELNQSYCYSFVMQHPDHRIVTSVTTPTLVCVAVFHGTEERLADIYPPWRFTFNTWEEAKEAAQQGLRKGLVFKRNGLRSKIRNRLHHSIESLKQNVPFPERYFKLTPAMRKEYLFYFPEDRVKIDLTETMVREKTTILYHTYRDCFRLKKQKAKDHPMKSALYDLHTIYLQELYPRPLSQKRVEEYVCKHSFLLKE